MYDVIVNGVIVSKPFSLEKAKEAIARKYPEGKAAHSYGRQYKVGYDYSVLNLGPCGGPNLFPRYVGYVVLTDMDDILSFRKII